MFKRLLTKKQKDTKLSVNGNDLSLSCHVLDGGLNTARNIQTIGLLPTYTNRQSNVIERTSSFRMSTGKSG